MTVVVTGGGAGIGRVIASRFADEGARVHICDIDPKVLESTLEAEPEWSGTVGDVRNPSDVRRVIREAEADGETVEVLVNNAGVSGPRSPIEDISDEDWDHVVKVNLYGPFHFIREVLPGMKARGRGVIINISTTSSRTVPLHRSVYSASRMGVEALTRSVAREAGPFGIRVNAIQPGMVNNERMRWVVARIARQEGKETEALEEELLRYVAMREKVEPHEIADMAVFLASDRARHVTGQVIGVDGFVLWEP